MGPVLVATWALRARTASSTSAHQFGCRSSTAATAAPAQHSTGRSAPPSFAPKNVGGSHAASGINAGHAAQRDLVAEIAETVRMIEPKLSPAATVTAASRADADVASASDLYA